MIVLFFLGFVLQGPPVDSALPSKPVLDNERVTVRAGMVAPGQPLGGDAGEDAVIVFMSSGSVKTPQGGAMHQAGDVLYLRAVDVRPEVMGAPLQAMRISLHRLAVPPLTNSSGYPEAFPRPGARKTLENDRVVMWDYRFTPGQPSPMHFHSRDTVVLYTEDGAVTSTTPDGMSTVNEHPCRPHHVQPRQSDPY